MQDAQQFIDEERYEDALFKLKAAFKVESEEHSYYTKLMGDICHCQMKVSIFCYCSVKSFQNEFLIFLPCDLCKSVIV